MIHKKHDPSLADSKVIESKSELHENHQLAREVEVQTKIEEKPIAKVSNH